MTTPQQINPAQSSFVLVGFENGSMMVGKATQSSILLWTTQGRKLELNDPRKLQPIPVSEHHVQLTLLPVWPTKTRQEQILISPAVLEEIGPISYADGEEVCDVDAVLFNAYKESLTAWKAEQSGISVPTKADLINLNSRRPKN